MHFISFLPSRTLRYELNQQRKRYSLITINSNVLM